MCRNEMGGIKKHLDRVLVIYQHKIGMLLPSQITLRLEKAVKAPAKSSLQLRFSYNNY